MVKAMIFVQLEVLLAHLVDLQKRLALGLQVVAAMACIPCLAQESPEPRAGSCNLRVPIRLVQPKI